MNEFPFEEYGPAPKKQGLTVMFKLDVLSLWRWATREPYAASREISRELDRELLTTNKYDACTMAPDALLTYDLQGCCLMHDEAYIYGTCARKEADKQFYNCLCKVSNKQIAKVYYTAVRMFGWIFWYKCRKAFPLSKTETL
jgi:hypothetical protein